MLNKRILSLQTGVISFVLSFALAFSVSASEKVTTAATIYDYYQGTELTPSELEQAFYWLELPQITYINSAYPDTLQDVRVFNGTGEEVPFTLFRDIEEKNSRFTTQLTLYPIQPEFIANSDSSENSERKLMIQTENGVSINLTGAVAKEKSNNLKAYMMVSEGEKPLELALERLSVSWKATNDNWQAKASVYTSSDKKNWSRLASDVPLIDLKSANEKLISRTIELDNSYRDKKTGPYWLIIVSSDKSVIVPEFTAVEGTAQRNTSQQRQETFKFEQTNDGNSSNQVIYRLPTAQLLNELKISLYQTNHVLPLKIEYQAGQDGPWLPLENYVAYSISDDNSEKISPPIELHNKMLRKIRITALKGSWGDTPPEITGTRVALNMIFNAQGTAPYLLVWGNKAAKNESLPLEQLLAKKMTPYQISTEFYEAHTYSPIIDLGGEKMLHNDRNEPVESMWQNYLLWTLLGGGVLLLGFFCWRLLRDLKQQPPENKL